MTESGAPMDRKEARAQAAADKAYAKSQRNWFARHKILTGLGVLALIIIIASATSGSGGGGTNTPAANDQTNTIAPADNQPASKAPAGPAAGAVLLSASGNGIKSTQKFTAASDWDLAYSFDCASFGQAGNFAVQVYGNDGQPSFSNTGPNELALKGNDVTHNHNGGTYYLEVNSECHWNIKVTAA